MGRKGVSKRKPKKSGSVSTSSERSLVQSLVKDNGAPLNRDGMTPSTGSNKTKKKR
jgi:hypothetical protein